MKIRNGFVSNSSSSSFLIIGTKDVEKPNLHSAYIHDNLLMIPQTFGGEYEFTESLERYDTFQDRLNAAAMLAFLKEGPGGWKITNTDWTSMLEEVLYETFNNIKNIKINFRWGDTADHCAYLSLLDVYVDSWFGNNSCYETLGKKIFVNKDVLEKWLFAPDSHIKVEYN